MGISAPQIGVSKRIIIADRKDRNGLNERYVMVNPEITKKRYLFLPIELCLSSPKAMRMIPRYRKVGVSYQDKEGEHHYMEAEKQDAAIIQHEIGHLEWILITDYLFMVRWKAVRKMFR